MTSSTPAHFSSAVDKAIAKLTSLSTKLTDEYDWAYGAAHSPTGAVGDKVKVGTADPTGSVVVNRAKMRRACEAAYKVVEETANDWQDAIRSLERALMSGQMVVEDFERRNPRTATRADLAEARQAQERRAGRGEATP